MSDIVMISGGSRGLGLAIATEWAKRGASLSLCARSAEELQSAREKLAKAGAGEVEVFVEDLARPDGPKHWVMETLLRFGRIDVLVNNAGIIEVGPLATMSEDAFRAALDANLWSTIRVTLAALPHLTQSGRIVNITSIGGAVSVPHLLPYSVSKFGALGFSLGLEAELSGRGVSVTSVLPGLMRTGSAIHARFRGDVKREFAWFSTSAALPLLTISADRAARTIVSSAMRRKRFVVLGFPAKALRVAHALFPNTTLAILRQVNHFLLPRPKGLPDQKPVVGKEVEREYIEGETPETIAKIASQTRIPDKAPRKPTRAPAQKHHRARKTRHA